MLYTSRQIGSKGTVPGIAGELDALKGDLSTIIVAARGSLLNGLGSPAGAKRVNRARVLERLDVYEDPAAQPALKSVTDGDLVRLTKEAIRARSTAQSRGEWAPKPVPEPKLEPAPIEPPIPAAFPSPLANPQPMPSATAMQLPAIEPIPPAPLAQPLPVSPRPYVPPAPIVLDSLDEAQGAPAL